MLSSNSSLQNGRYRIIGLFGEADGGRLYDAFDDQLSLKLVINESSANDNFSERLNALKNRRIKGIVQIRDGFVEGSNTYLATEPLDGRASAEEFVKDPANSIGMLLSGIQSLLADNATAASLDINPQMIRRAQDGNNCLLSFSVGPNANDSRNNHKLTPFAALETVWPGLDMATQKAITNACDEDALAAIDSPADERTAVFSLASAIYQIVAGKSPLDVLVRAIELLDEKADPLKKLAELRPSIDSSFSEVISRMMTLRRNDRPSLADAATMVAGLKPKQAIPASLDIDDEFDLLEIPFEVNERPQIAEPKPFVATTASHEPALPAMLASIEENEEIAPVVAESLPNVVEPVEEVVVVKETPVLAPKIVEDQVDADIPGFAMEAEAKSSGAGLKIAGAAAGLLIVAVIGWFVLGGGNGASASASTATPERKAEPVASTVEPSGVSNSSTVEPIATQPEPATFLPTESQPKVDDPKQPKRPVVAEVKPQVKPTPAKTEKPKKAVTVDDLLNDN